MKFSMSIDPLYQAAKEFVAACDATGFGAVAPDGTPGTSLDVPTPASEDMQRTLFVLLRESKTISLVVADALREERARG